MLYMRPITLIRVHAAGCRFGKKIQKKPEFLAETEEFQVVPLYAHRMGTYASTFNLDGARRTGVRVLPLTAPSPIQLPSPLRPAVVFLCRT
jgi:hypothetical protein